MSENESPDREEHWKQVRRQEEKLKRGEFTLDDYRKQMEMICKPGFIQRMMAMLPEMEGMRDSINAFDRNEMKCLISMIDSMTLDEKEDSKLIDQSRCLRIAAGAGRDPYQVHELIKQYDAMSEVMTSIASKGSRSRPHKDLKLSSDEKDDDSPPEDPLPPLPA